MATTYELNPLERAAVFLMSLPAEEATKIIKHLGAKEVQKLGKAMASLNHVEKRDIQKIFSDFIAESDNQSGISVNKEEKIKKLLVNALGETKANSIIDNVLSGKNAQGLENLKWMDAKTISELIGAEHPQIQAIVISYLDPDQAAEVLMLINENLRVEILERISNQESIQPAAIEELNKIMEKQLSGTKIEKPQPIGGVKCVASILKHIDSKAEAGMLEQLKERNTELVSLIEELMFVFDNLKEIDDKGLQILIREVKSDTLIVALKAADTELKDKIFRNMSKRSAQLLKDDMEVKGPVKVTEVEEAQKEIILVAKKLAEQGKIMLGTSKEEMI